MKVITNENPSDKPIDSEWGKYVWEKSDNFLSCPELELCLRYNQVWLSPPYPKYALHHGSSIVFNNNFYTLRTEFYKIVNTLTNS